MTTRRGFRIFTDSAGIPHKRGGMAGITPMALPIISSNGIARQRKQPRWQTGGIINQTGYLKGAKTNKNPVNIIPSSHITTDGMIGPILANGQLLHPDTGDYHFNSPFVVEHRLKWGGKTPTAPKYLSIYPETQQPMKRSFRGRKPMKVGGQHYDPQLGNYMSNIYAFGGLSGFGYPYYGYNDSERGMLSGMMQAGGITAQSAAAAMGSGYGDHAILDRLAGILTQNRRPTATGNPNQDSLGMQAYIYRQTHPGLNPTAAINGFYGRPYTNTGADSLRRNIAAIGYGPMASYNDSRDVSLHGSYLWGGDIPDIRNMSPQNGIKTRRVTTSNISKGSPSEFGDYDWTTTPSGGYKKGGKHWIQGAINPAHKGYCTPMSKPTCTGHRRALALMFKRKHGFHKHAVGGMIPGQYLQGFEMQQGGPAQLAPFQVGGLTSFTPAGSLIDQNQWAMSPDGTSIAPPAGNYYKTDPSQQGPMFNGSLTGGTNSPRYGSKSVNSLGTLNMNNLSLLLPANAMASGLADAHAYNQLNSWRRQNMNNPLTTLGRDDGRSNEARYGYQPFQYGGINGQPRSNEGRIRFAGRPMKLWQRGGDIGDIGATRKFHPYMLHQGRFQQGGGIDIDDEWDMEDAQDQQGAQQLPPQQDDGFAPDDRDFRRRADLDDDEDYQNALQVAMENSSGLWMNPYQY